MEECRIQVGMPADLAHPRLCLTLFPMHENPAREWSLQEFSENSAMLDLVTPAPSVDGPSAH